MKFESKEEEAAESPEHEAAESPEEEKAEHEMSWIDRIVNQMSPEEIKYTLRLLEPGEPEEEAKREEREGEVFKGNEIVDLEDME